MIVIFVLCKRFIVKKKDWCVSSSLELQTVVNDIPLDGSVTVTQNGVIITLPQVLKVRRNRCSKMTYLQVEVRIERRDGIDGCLFVRVTPASLFSFLSPGKMYRLWWTTPMHFLSQTSKKTVIVRGVDIITETQAFPKVILTALKMTPKLTHSDFTKGTWKGAGL